MEQGDELNMLCTHWSKAIDLAQKDRKERFMDVAMDIKKFYDSDHRFLYDGKYKSRFMAVEGADGSAIEPRFRVTINKAAEYVSLHLPVLYHRNPNRTVTPRTPAISSELMAALQLNPANSQSRFIEDQARAQLLQYLLNVWPIEMDLKREARQAITEALVYGRGVLWCELEAGPGGNRPGLFYEPVENLFIDPDAEQLRHAGWIARKRTRRLCDIEYERGMPPGTLKGKSESSTRQAELYSEGTDGEMARKAGKSSDLGEYYEIYSRMGLGKIKGFPQEVTEILDTYGDEVYLEVMPGCDYPLNLTKDFIDSLSAEVNPEERARMIHDAIGWPTRFYKNPTWPWPFAPLDFCYVSKSVWPMAPLAPAMGYQEFLDWAYSFMSERLPISCRTFLATPKGQELETTETVLNGCDMSLIRYDAKLPQQSWDKIVGFIQPPGMNRDIFDVTVAIEKKFEEATGMTQLAYGNPGDTQSRSAADVQIRQQNLSIRPDDMANKVEDWMSLAAQLQVVCAREHLGPADVAGDFGETFDDSKAETPPVAGEMTFLWMQLCAGREIEQIIGDFEYRVESGSARKPNKAAQVERASQLLQTLMPVLMPQYQTTGDPTQVNAILRDYLKANDWANPDEVLFPNMQQQMMEQQMAMQQQQATVPMQASA